MNSVIRNTTFAAVSALALISTAACGGGGTAPPASVAPTPTPAPAPSPSPSPSPTATDFTQVTNAIDAHNDNNFAVLIGTVDGQVYSYTKGTFPLDQQNLVASASKWLTSATIMRLVDRGVMSLSDRPQDYLSYWTDDPMDPRSRITLEQLLSFTSGFNARPSTLDCTPNITATVQNCVQQVYEEGIDTEPGAAYSYGPEHMQIAAAMAEIATGQAYADNFRNELADPLGMSEASAFLSPTSRNPLASGGAASTAQDYKLFLQALLREELFTDTDAFLTDRIADADIAFRPRGAAEFGDWHYALGAFVECDQQAFDQSCVDAQTYSSPGSFGWTPWIDRRTGYWALIARRGERNTAPVAVELQQQLQPLIEEALGQ